jgi:hypothetical protein
MAAPERLISQKRSLDYALGDCAGVWRVEGVKGLPGSVQLVGEKLKGKAAGPFSFTIEKYEAVRYQDGEEVPYEYPVARWDEGLAVPVAQAKPRAINATDRKLLLLLAEAGGWLPRADLIKQSGINADTATTAFGRLLDQKLIEKDGEGKNGVRYRITEAGRQRIA